jgi:hypothetical protein
MYSFRRFALYVALASSALPAVLAQSTSPATSPASSPAAPDSSQVPQSATPQAPSPQTSGSSTLSPSQLSVQARIRARREKRRADAIHEAYNHLYEGYVGAGYLRFTPGPTLQKVNEYDWNVGFTRYFNERLGATIDGRGYYGTPFIEPNEGDPPAGDIGLTKPTISQYAALIGPTYRFYLQPRYSVGARVMGGFAHGNFTGDTNGYGTLGVLYPSASTFAAEASVYAEYNIAPNLGFRVAPEYYLTGFGSTIQNNLGYNIGLVIRVGKQ